MNKSKGNLIEVTMTVLEEVVQIQESYKKLIMDGKITKKQICDLVVPFKEKYRLSALMALTIVRNELTLKELSETIKGFTLETVKNDAYLHNCKCPSCGNTIKRGYEERVFYCDECGAHLHQRAFTKKEINEALFEEEIDNYEDN